MVARLTDGCDMRCQWQLAVDEDIKVASGLGDSDARAEHQDLLARDLVEQQAQAKPHQLCLCRVQLQSICAQQFLQLLFIHFYFNTALAYNIINLILIITSANVDRFSKFF